jgi:hypothetical protein
MDRPPPSSETPSKQTEQKTEPWDLEEAGALEGSAGSMEIEADQRSGSKGPGSGADLDLDFIKRNLGERMDQGWIDGGEEGAEEGGEEGAGIRCWVSCEQGFFCAEEDREDMAREAETQSSCVVYFRRYMKKK